MEIQDPIEEVSGPASIASYQGMEGVPVEAPQVLLDYYLKTLRLPSFARE